jgi:hypothetical protein
MPMTDAKIARGARRIKSLEAQIATLQATANKLKNDIRQEMETRGTTGLETAGVRVSYVAPVRLSYDEELLQRRLRSKWDLVTRKVLDKDLLAAAVAEGRIRSAVVAECTTEVPSKPYVRISIHDDEDEVAEAV